MHYFVIWLFKLNLSPQELKFSVALSLDSIYLLLLSRLPDFVQIFEKLVHESWRNLPSALVSECVGNLESILGDPVFHFFRFFESLEFGLVLGEMASRGLSLWIKIPHTGSTVRGELAEVFKLLG
jgi:hypothetical protein